MTYLELQKHVEKQIKNFLCFEIDVSKYIIESIERTFNCLSKSKSKYCIEWKENEVPFSVYNSLHYCIFLYQMSKCAFEIDKNSIYAEKFYYLNKIINSVDLFYEIDLPEIWGIEHPLGSVMGRAKYSNFFFFYQGCTVGGNKGCYPEIGSYVIMYSNSKILGNSKIGNNVIISANTYIKDEIIPSNSIVFGQSPNLIIKRKTQEEIRSMMQQLWK